MKRLEVVSMAAGSALVVGGAAWIYAPAGLIVLGGLMLFAGWPR